MAAKTKRSASDPSGMGRRASKRKPTHAEKSTACHRRRRRQGAMMAAPEMKRQTPEVAIESESKSTPSNQGKVASRRKLQPPAQRTKELVQRFLLMGKA